MSNKLVPVVRAEGEEAEEEELVDPQVQLREQCAEKAHCKALYTIYQECNDRVNSRTNTAEVCDQELNDYIEVLDKCVSKDLWSRLK